MNLIIPFESKVKFDSPVKEICSISLEHEITKNDDEVLGNFILSGTYKEHELSVNTIDFNFTIPFSVELNRNIEKDSIEVDIDNFTYDIDNNVMSVKIDYVVSGEEVNNSEEILSMLESEDEIVREDVIQDNSIEKDEIIEEVVIEEEKNESEEMYDVSFLKTEEDFITYHVHTVKENETFESISIIYKTDKDEICKLNNITSISMGDKILVPICNE